MRIRTLLPMACDGVGPSQTCLNIVRGMNEAGATIDVFVNRMRIPRADLPVRSLLYAPFSRIPYPLVRGPLTKVLENWYLRTLADEDVAYLWPTASLHIHREIQRRSIPIVLEGINTRMKSAKVILERAYAEFGAPAQHEITEARIREEEEKLSLATAIFAPSPGVETALEGLPIAAGMIRTSYGIDVPPVLPPLARSHQQNKVVFLFCGYACVRKGIHRILELWPRMPSTAQLRIVGRIEPVIGERFASILSSGRVELVGFVDDVATQFATSDVFVLPSLEEGDPLVTYEAAIHGLPVLASPMGAGRMRDAAWVVDPGSPDGLLAALLSLHDSAEMRQQWGERSQRTVTAFDWSKVGTERLHGLESLLLAGGY